MGARGPAEPSAAPRSHARARTHRRSRMIRVLLCALAGAGTAHGHAVAVTTEPRVRFTVGVCGNRDCARKASQSTLGLFKALNPSPHSISVVASGCQNRCASGPSVRVQSHDGSEQSFFSEVTQPATVAAILEVACDQLIDEGVLADVSAGHARPKGPPPLSSLPARP